MSADTEPESPWNECEVCGATMPAAAIAVGLRVCSAKCRKEQTDFYDEILPMRETGEREPWEERRDC